MPLYSARPPLTPPRILSVRLRRSWGRAGGPGGGGGGAQAGGAGGGGGGGGGGAQAGGSRAGGGGGVGGGADVMTRRLPSGGPGNHQGRPPSDPGSSSGVIPRVGPGFPGATIGGVTITATGAPPRPPLARPQSGRVLAGVAAGTAAHLRQDPVIVRVAFVVLAAMGVGVVLYGLLWLTMPAAEPGAETVVTLKSGET